MLLEISNIPLYHGSIKVAFPRYNFLPKLLSSAYSVIIPGPQKNVIRGKKHKE